MSIGFIIGNMVKNLFCIPRPSSNLVFRLRPNDADDYSMPSTHSLQAISLPLWFTIYMINDLGYNSILFFSLWFFAFAIWTLSVSLSRVYLGAHSFQDIFIGWIMGILISISYSTIYPYLEMQLMNSNRQFAFFLILLSIFLVYIHPIEISINSNLAKWNVAVSQSGYLTSSSLAGVIAGLALGVINMPKNIQISFYQLPIQGLLRFTLGPLLCFIVYYLSKKAFKPLLLFAWKIFNVPLFDPLSTIQSSLNTNQSLNDNQKTSQTQLTFLLIGSGFQVMPILKFLQYGALAWTVIAGSPIFFNWIGI